MGDNLRRGCDRNPGVSGRGIDVARYQVESRPEGPVGRLDVPRPDVAPGDLRAWLADRLEELRGVPGRHEETGVASFDGQVAVEGGLPRLSSFRFGPHPAPDDWPRIPLADLLEAGAAALRPG
jgi:hypothetical protein